MSLITSSWSVLVSFRELSEKQAQWFGRYRASTRLHSFRDHPDEPWVLVECDSEAAAVNLLDVLLAVLEPGSLRIVSFGEEI